MHNVVVTGGSRGIGLAISRRLAAAGYNLIAVARRESGELREAIGEVVKQGSGGLHFRAFDLSDVDAIPSFVKALRDEFGAIYGLVNNAGIGTEGLLATMHNTEIEALVRLNVTSPIILTKYIARHMMADGAGGRIINMSSIIATTGYNGLCQCDCAGFRRYRIDAKPFGRSAQTYLRPQRLAPAAGDRRCRPHGRIPPG